MSGVEQAAQLPATEHPSSSPLTRNGKETRPSVSQQETSQRISLLDRAPSSTPSDQQREEQEATSSSADSLSRRWTKQSLHQSLTQRKYAKYQEDRLFVPESRQAAHSGSEDEQGRLQWGKKKVKGLLKTKRQFQLARQEDAAIDVLWENQRGWWAFGVPHFSSKSLLNFDPKPWLNTHRKPSPVNITNAQVPDPNWEWEWKSWYVDMSRDVDEEGWEYSFSFSQGFAWHGNHPWGHSWVRRRRWLRKRVRKHTHHQDGRNPSARHLSEAHHLNADYFTIHPSNNLSRSNSLAPSSLLAKAQLRRENEYNEEPQDVKDIGTLLVHLKRAALDREKIVLVRAFVDNAGEDVYYLAEQMATIMSLCIFQNSRRQLLSMLMEKCDEGARHRAEHEKSGKKEGPQEKRRIDNLMLAINAADQQVKKLEYWSDQRRLVCEGHAGTAPDDVQGRSQWQGLDQSGPNSNVRTTAKEKGQSIDEVVVHESSPPDGDDESEVEELSEVHEEEKSGEDDDTETVKEEASESVDKPELEEQRVTRMNGQEQESSSDRPYDTAQEDRNGVEAKS